MLDLVHREPGIHKSALGRRLGLGWGSVSYHLQTLQRQRRVRTVQHKRECHIFPADAHDEDLRLLLALRGPAPLILEFLRNNPAASIRATSNRLGIDRRVVARHVQETREAGLLPVAFGHPEPVRVQPTLPEQPQPDGWGELALLQRAGKP